MLLTAALSVLGEWSARRQGGGAAGDPYPRLGRVNRGRPLRCLPERRRGAAAPTNSPLERHRAVRRPLGGACPAQVASLMGVGWEAVVRVLTDSVVPLPSLPVGIDVDHNAAEVRQVVKELVPDLLRDLVAVPHR